MNIELELTYDTDNGLLVLKNEKGDTYSSKSEELQDFLNKEILEFLGA